MFIKVESDCRILNNLNKMFPWKTPYAAISILYVLLIWGRGNILRDTGKAQSNLMEAYILPSHSRDMSLRVQNKYY